MALRAERCAAALMVIAFAPRALAGSSSSALDFVKIAGAAAIAVGFSAGADSAGDSYTVGCLESAAGFPTTPGALDTQGTRPMGYLQKFSPDGTSLLASALLGETGECSSPYPLISAKVDAEGDIYVAFQLSGNVAGVSEWTGDPNGSVAVIKVSSQADRILYATKVFAYMTGPLALDIDSSGSCYVALGEYDDIRVAKLDPSGAPTAFSFTLTDTPGGGAGTGPYDGHWLSIAAGLDGSVYVAGSPNYVYRIDPAGQNLLYRTQISGSLETLASIAVDGAGNAYIAGSIPFPNGSAAIALNRIGFTQAFPGATHGMLLKLDASGNTVYSDAFETSALTAVAVDANGNAWAAGSFGGGITLLELNAAGTSLLHFISLAATAPADLSDEQNQANGIALDASGRPLVAGVTGALNLPDPQGGNASTGAGGSGANGFLLRVNVAAPQTDLQIAISPSTSDTCVFCAINYEIQVTNGGPASANDVLLDLEASGYMPVLGCRTTGAGTCVTNGQITNIAFASLAPGETENVEILSTVPALPPGYGEPQFFYYGLDARTSTDDPNQSNNQAFSSAPIQTVDLLLGGVTGMFVVGVNGNGLWPFGGYPGVDTGVPVPANTEDQIYVPSPQFAYGSPWVFTGWSDGSTANPRTFDIGTSSPPVVTEWRQVTEPWVSPDAPAVHAASYRTGAVAPGEVLSIFGYNLGPAQLATAQLDSSGRVSANVAGLQVLFGNAPAPIVFASATNSAVIVPYSVAGQSTVQMSIQYNGKTSAATTLNVTDSAPGLFTLNMQGTGPLAAYNADGSLNSLQNPAAPGSIVVFYASGEGVTNPLPADGAIAGSEAPSPVLPVSVTIEGQPATVLYAGGVPTVTAGVMQINAQIPANVDSGLLQVILTVGSHSSQPGATIAVR